MWFERSSYCSDSVSKDVHCLHLYTDVQRAKTLYGDLISSWAINTLSFVFFERVIVLLNEMAEWCFKETQILQTKSSLWSWTLYPCKCLHNSVCHTCLYWLVGHNSVKYRQFGIILSHNNLVLALHIEWKTEVVGAGIALLAVLSNIVFLTSAL